MLNLPFDIIIWSLSSWPVSIMIILDFFQPLIKVGEHINALLLAVGVSLSLALQYSHLFFFECFAFIYVQKSLDAFVLRHVD